MNQQGQSKDLEVLESEDRTYTIRGQETTVKIAKAKGDEGSEYRQVTAIFKSKDDAPAMLMVLMPEEEWTTGGEASLDQMFRSMQ